MENKNKEILVKALEKAINNGMKAPTIRKINDKAVEKEEIYDGYYESIILSIDFARAFWMDHPIEWDHQLRYMILEENRFAYLEEFL